MKETIRFQLNGKPVSLLVEPDRALLWVLRCDLGLTGTKYGCGEALCGACTVLVDKQALRSCRLAVNDLAGKEVVTIEGLANGDLHPLQKAFIQQDALQCGFCTPGMIMNAYGILLQKPRPSRTELVDKMDGNLCRCGTYRRILEAVEAASKEMEALRT